MGRFCCHGCELAAELTAVGGDDKRRLYARITLSLLLAMLVMMLSLFLYAEDVYGPEASLGWMRSGYRVAALVLSTPVMAMLGIPLARRGIAAWRSGELGMNLLVVTGAMAAYGLSVVRVLQGRHEIYFDSASSALVLTTLGRYLEARARAEAGRVLVRASEGPRVAVVVERGDATRLVQASEIDAGEVMRLRSGDVLAVDARVTSLDGAAIEVSLAVLTGVSVPVSRVVGDELPAGAVVLAGGARCVALRGARDSTVERLCELARSLLQRPSALQRRADAFATVLLPLVFVLALGALAYHGRTSIETGITAALAVTLAACPCTFGITTPLTLWLALRRALERGVCLRDATVLERLAAIEHVAFDKTGTLTEAAPAVVGVAYERAGEESRVRGVVRALETGIEHPMARALLGWAGEGAHVALRSRAVLLGRGVEGVDVSGCRVALMRDDASSQVVLTEDGVRVAAFRVSESLRAESAAAVSQLAALGIDSRMLTGDHAEGANDIASQLDIPAQAALSPEGKLGAIGATTSLAMVGDGLNDAPALASALGVATADSTPVAKAIAPVVLLQADLRLVPWVIGLSRRAVSLARQGLVLSTAYNLVFLGLAATGHLRPVLAGVSMLTSSLFAVLWSLRVRSYEGVAP